MRARSGAVLDADVVLARLERRHAAHGRARDLFDRIATGEFPGTISTVNLAEVLMHSRQFRQVTGLDLGAFLCTNRLALHAPEAEVAEQVAALAGEARLSLADRFAAATAKVLSARLFTTDVGLAKAAGRHRILVTRF